MATLEIENPNNCTHIIKMSSRLVMKRLRSKRQAQPSESNENQKLQLRPKTFSHKRLGFKNTIGFASKVMGFHSCHSSVFFEEPIYQSSYVSIIGPFFFLAFC